MVKNYSGAQFVKDLVARIIVAIIALPLSIALAIASRVNPEQDVYTAVVVGFSFPFLGGSRVQIGELIAILLLSFMELLRSTVYLV